MSMNPNWPTDPPKKAGMGTTAKVLLWLGGGFLVLGLLCCGAGAVIFYKVKGGFSEDPTVVAQKTQEIVDWQVPADFKPKFSLDMLTMMTMVFYEVEPAKGVLMIGQFGKMFEGQDKQQLEDQMKNSMRQQGKGGGKELQIEEQQTHKFTIHGKETDFVFAKAKDPDSGREMWQVTGAFEGKGGVAFMLLQVERDEYTEEELKELIGEIK
jgi:hypothetical protein